MDTPKDPPERRPFAQADVFRARHVLDGVLSPDGRVAVFQVTETHRGPSADEDRQTTALWRVDVAGGEPRRLTPRGGTAGSPQFAADGGAVYFLSARDPEGRSAQVHKLPLDGGEAEAVTSADGGVGTFALSPDGEWIAFAAMKAAPEPKGPNDHVRISRIAYRLDSAPGYLQDLAQAVYLVPAAGGDARTLTSHDGLIGALVWSPDSTKIAATIVAKEAHAAMPLLGDLCVVDRSGAARIVVEKSLITTPFWTADGQRIGYVAPPGDDLSSQNQVFVVDVVVGAPVSRTSALGRTAGGGLQTHNPGGSGPSRPLLTGEGDAVILAVGVGGENNLHRIALAGVESCQPLTKGQRCCKPLDRVGDVVLFTSQDFTTPTELFVLDLATLEERALTDLNADWTSKIAWPAVERLVATSAPGVEIEGWVITPSHLEAPYRTILWIHGGPHGAYGCTFNEDFLEMVGAGYAVAYCNPRGSINYGDAFAKAILGVWGLPELEDFTAFLDELERRGVARPDALGVTGISGGGHLSAWLIGRTDRFKAAVPEQGVYNMFSMYGVSDAGPTLIALELGGPPHEQVQRYWEHSPIAYAHTVKTPTLLIQGENDVRCPMEQAEQYFTVLKLNGCEVELLRLNNCNHGAQIRGAPPLRRVRIDALREWFDRHIPA